MNIEQIRTYIISMPHVEETFPFDDVTLVFKVGGKMFALLPLDEENISINVKCNPEIAIELREQYESITGGYHMSKKHWNTLAIYKNELSKSFVFQQIRNSYDLVYNSLPKKVKEVLR